MSDRLQPLRGIENRLYRAVRDSRASAVTGAQRLPWDLQHLHGHKYCLLTSYRASGAAVATPVWFGREEGRIYIRSGAQDGKVKRIRRNPRVLVAPCSARGKPLGPAMVGHARILDPSEHARGEAALRRDYGLGRKLYRITRRRLDVAYLEVGTPAHPDR